MKRPGCIARKTRLRSGPKAERPCSTCGTQITGKPSRFARVTNPTCGNPDCVREIRRRNASAQVRPWVERFWERVQKGDGCWLWVGHVARHGYGTFSVRGRQLRAHRVSYELAHGPVQDGLFVCHHCDNPRCVNPTHLYAGTHLDNMADRESRGRGRALAGDDCGARKLRSTQVQEIRRQLATGCRKVDLAKKYGVGETAIKRIARGETWRSVA